MDYFSPGLHEFTRILERVLNRWRLRRAERDLQKAETELGLLGWQQAEYDAETQREVDKIKNVEREQARLTNESAELARVLAPLETERDTLAREIEEQRIASEAEIDRRRAVNEAKANEIAKVRETMAGGERWMSNLERELRDAQRKYNELINKEDQTAEIRAEAARLRDRTNAIPQELAEAQRRQLRLTSDLSTLEGELRREDSQVDEYVIAVRATEAGHAARLRAVSQEIKKHTRTKGQLDEAVDRLEKDKANPYQQIGRVLADNNISPMNQPHALAAVHEVRKRAAEYRAAIIDSYEISSATNRELARYSMVLWLAIVVAVLLVGGALLL